MSQTPYDKQRPKRTPPHMSLRDVRAVAGLTQEAVCQRVAAITDKTFTKGALAAIELGHRGASEETLAAIETALGAPAGSLVLTYQPSHVRRKIEAA